MTYLEPTAYPVVPKQWRIFDRGGKRQVAVMMPYPTLDNGAKCVNDDAYLTESCNGDSEKATLDYMRAKCESCPLVTACREWGIAHEGHLMFGGLTPTERKVIRKERGQVLLEPSNAHVYGMNTEFINLRGMDEASNSNLTKNRRVSRRKETDMDVYAGDLDLEEFPYGTYPSE